MTITVSPFTTSRDANGAYSLTLAQLTSVFLAEIEKLFGPRDSKFTYVGLEIDTTRNAKPRIWFPHTGYPGRQSDKPSQHIVIRLTQSAHRTTPTSRYGNLHMNASISSTRGTSK